MTLTRRRRIAQRLLLRGVCRLECVAEKRPSRPQKSADWCDFRYVIACPLVQEFAQFFVVDACKVYPYKGPRDCAPAPASILHNFQ